MRFSLDCMVVKVLSFNGKSLINVLAYFLDKKIDVKLEIKEI